MSFFRNPLEVPTRYQWDADSRLPLPDPGTAPGNCGMTCVTIIAQYYRDTFFGIYSTRRLSGAPDWKMSSTVSEQSTSLTKRGVPNTITRPTVAQLHKYLSTHRRPIAIGLDMSRVPLAVAGHPFRGSHGILLRANLTKNGQIGFSVIDPNFNRTYRTDPTKGHRFYRDDVIQEAYFAAGKWAIVPRADKIVPPPWWGRVKVAGPGVSIRESAKETSGNVWAKSRANGYTYRESDGQRLFANSYQYYWNGDVVKSDDGPFYRVKTHSGDTKYIRTGAAVVVRNA